MQTYNTLEDVRCFWFPPGHGKGPCDAHFGVMAGWLQSAALRHVVDSLDVYCRLMNEAAEALFVDAPKALPIALSALFGSAAGSVASLLRWEGEGAPPAAPMGSAPRQLARQA